MQASEIASIIESVAPVSSGMDGDELGFVFGDGRVEVRGVAVCWSPTLAVIAQAERLGCNTIVSHEPLFYQKRWSADAEAGNQWFDEAEDADKAVNRKRREALERMGACVYRAHSNWDLAPGIGILDALISTLGLGPAARRGRFTTVHHVPPVSVRELAQRVQERLHAGPIRIVGDLDRRVTRVGTLIGGLGQLFNAPEEPASLGAEAVVAGECLDYTLRHAQELDIALIEAGHCASENPGMRAMARWLAEKQDEVKVEFIDSGRPWQYLAE